MEQTPNSPQPLWRTRPRVPRRQFCRRFAPTQPPPPFQLPPRTFTPTPTLNSPLVYQVRRKTSMSTPHRININRANSQHSTGPKTAEGKQRSSLNALRHGLTGQIVVMPDRRPRRPTSLHLKFFVRRGPAPTAPPKQIWSKPWPDTSWRLNRVAALETNLLTLGVMHTSPLTGAPEPIQDAMSIVAALESQSKALSNLSLHSATPLPPVLNADGSPAPRLSSKLRRALEILGHRSTCSTSWKCTSRPKEKPTKPFLKMASFFQKSKSTRHILRRNRERLLDEVAEQLCAD